MTGEPEAATLGIADTQSLDRRGLLLGLFTHPQRIPAIRCQPRQQLPTTRKVHAMAQQPSWRGHRAPVEDPTNPGVATRERPERRSRLLLLAGVAMSGLVVAGCAVVALRLTDAPAAAKLPELTAGACLDSNELARGETDLRSLRTTDCGALHDAEIFALRKVGDDGSLTTVGEHCLAEAGDLGVDVNDLADRSLEVRPLALTTSPRAGDTVACFVRHKSGTPLRGAVFTLME